MRLNFFGFCITTILISGVLSFVLSLFALKDVKRTKLQHNQSFIQNTSDKNLNQIKLKSFDSILKPNNNLNLSGLVDSSSKKTLDSFFQNTNKDWCPKKNSNGGRFIIDMYKKAAMKHQITCNNTQRIGHVGDGGKIICVDNLEKSNCIVYSLGSRLDFTFENDIFKQFECEIHTFDCTVGNTKNIKFPKHIVFHPWCIGGKDEKNKISSDFGHTGDIGQYYTLATIMKRLNHKFIDILKMDIERHEFAVIHSLQQNFAPRQIAFETHIHNAYGIWHKSVTEAEWISMWNYVYGLNYGVYSYELNPLCLCCCEFSMMHGIKTKIGRTSNIMI